MVRVQGEILIDRPREEVFDFVADQENEPRTLQPRAVLRLMGPLVAAMGRRQEQRIWMSLKRLLESRSR